MFFVEMAHIAYFNGMDHLLRVRRNMVIRRSPWCWSFAAGGGASLIRLCGRRVCRPNGVKRSSPWWLGFASDGGGRV
jgi:hypothetical protein